MNPNEDLEPLFARVCDGLASEAELSALHQRLRNDPAALDAWVHYTELHAELAAGDALAAKPAPGGHEGWAAAATSAGTRAASRGPRPRSWSSWLPQLAAAVVAGFVAASVVWAYVLPPGPRSLVLLDETFDDPAVSPSVRTALKSGVWRGDDAVIAGEEDNVKPAAGQHMLRFLRADYEGKAKPAGGHIAVVYHLIDLRPHHRQLADGSGVVEVSASFNAREFPATERYGCAISLYALDADSVPDRAGRLGTTLNNEALAMARSSRTLLDADPATWQRLTTELRLPGNAEFLVVRLHIHQMFESAPDFAFTGSYVDDVRVTLTHRAPLP